MRLIYPRLSANQHHIVAYIHDNPGCTQGQIIDALPIAGAVVAWALDRLIRRGIVADRGSNRCQLYLPMETEQ